MKKDKNEIIKLRNSRKNKILFIGVTGFLGSHIALSLLKEKYELIFLIRRKRDESPEERLKKIFDWFNITDNDNFNYEIIEGNIETQDFGLSPDDYNYLVENISEIFNAAGETSFNEKMSDKIRETNINGLKNILNFAQKCGCYFFHHISTAYSAGKVEGVCKEELFNNNNFYNDYEESKNAGEKLCYELCNKNGIRLNIYRPSIVYGDSATGRTFRFNALYYPIKTLLFLKNVFLKDIENGDENAKEIGIKTYEDGKVFFPIRFEKNSGGSINIIPVDYFTNAVITIFNESLEGDIFHITNKNKTVIDDILSYIMKHFNLDGLKTVEIGDFEQNPKNGLEILFDNYIQQYLPYFYDLRQFLNEKTDSILSKYGVGCPKFSYDIFKVCFDYAVKTNWGKNL